MNGFKKWNTFHYFYPFSTNKTTVFIHTEQTIISHEGSENTRLTCRPNMQGYIISHLLLQNVFIKYDRKAVIFQPRHVWKGLYDRKKLNFPQRIKTNQAPKLNVNWQWRQSYFLKEHAAQWWTITYQLKSFSDNFSKRRVCL